MRKATDNLRDRRVTFATDGTHEEKARATTSALALADDAPRNDIWEEERELNGPVLASARETNNQIGVENCDSDDNDTPDVWDDDTTC